MLQFKNEPPSFGDLVGVGRTQYDEPGNAAQPDHLLDRLMRRAVFADPDRIVGKDIDDRQLHQRAEPDRRPSYNRRRSESPSRRAAISTPTCRCRSSPSRARGCRNENCGRRGRRPRNRPRRGKSAGSWSRGPDRPRRPAARAGAGRSRSAPAPRSRGWRCPWGRLERPEYPGPSRRADRAAGCARSCIGEIGMGALVPRRTAPAIRPVAFARALPNLGGEMFADSLRYEEFRVLGPAVTALGLAHLLFA